MDQNSTTPFSPSDSPPHPPPPTPQKKTKIRKPLITNKKEKPDNENTLFHFFLNSILSLILGVNWGKPKNKQKQSSNLSLITFSSLIYLFSFFNIVGNLFVSFQTRRLMSFGSSYCSDNFKGSLFSIQGLDLTTSLFSFHIHGKEQHNK